MGTIRTSAQVESLLVGAARRTLGAREALTRASTLVKATGDEALTGIARDYGLLRSQMVARRYIPDQGILDALYTLQPLFGACALAALLALPLMLALSRLISRLSESRRWMVAPLVWLLLIPLAASAIPGGPLSPVPFAALALLAPLGALPGTRKPTLVLGLVGAVVAIVALRASPASWALAIAVALALEVARSDPKSVPVAIASTTFACLVVGAVAGFAALRGSGWNALGLSLFAALVLTPAVSRARPGERQRAAAASVALLGAVYLAAVLAGIRADAQAGAVHDALMNEATRMRTEAGVGNG